jgi:hypothetical protein
MRIAVQRSPTVLFITFDGDLAHNPERRPSVPDHLIEQKISYSMPDDWQAVLPEKAGGGVIVPEKIIPSRDVSEGSVG